MRGLENIISMRLAGKVPTVVWVEMFPMQEWTKQLTKTPDTHVDVHVAPEDVPSIESRDLRCLVGLQTVLVNGPDDDSTDRVAAACFKAGPQCVESVRFDISNPYRPQITRVTRYTQDGVKQTWPR